MIAYYRNGKAVAAAEGRRRTIGNEPTWVYQGNKRKAICRECHQFRVERSFTSVWDAGVQMYVRIDICKECDRHHRFQDIPETGIWESKYWQQGTVDTENRVPNSGLPVDYLQHNSEYHTFSRVHEFVEMKYSGKHRGECNATE